MAWSVLQSASAATAFGTGLESNTVTLGSNCTSGSVLIAYVQLQASVGTPTTVSVKDGALNAFTQIAQVQSPAGGNGNFTVASVWAMATPAGDVGTTPTIKATPRALGVYAGGLLVQEVSGIQASTDGSAANVSGSASGSTGTPSYASAAANEYLVSFYSDVDNGGTSFTAPSGYTADAHNVNGSTTGGNIGVAYENSTGGTESDGWTATAFGWVVFLVAFQLSAAAADGSPAVPQQVRSRFRQRRSARQLARQMPWPLSMDAPATAAPVPQLLQPPTAVSRHALGRARAGKLGACAAGILAATTLSPQPSAVPPSRPQPVIAHPAPHRATAKGILAPARLPFTTAKLPPTAISPRPPHRGTGKGVLAKTTLSPQPSVVFPVPRPVLQRPPPPHRAQWRGLPGPAPSAVAVTSVPPSRPPPTVNRPPAPHRAIIRQAFAPGQPSYLTAKLPPTAVSKARPHRGWADGILAKTTFAPQPSRVPPPQWRQPNAPRPAHRAIWRGVAGPAPAVAQAAPVVSRPLPVINRHLPPHRATARWLLAKTTLSAQPSSVPAPHWQPQPRHRPPHRVTWRVIAGPPPPPPPAIQVATSVSAVTDPRDGTGRVTAAASSVSAVTDPRDPSATAALLQGENGNTMQDEAGGGISGG